MEFAEQDISQLIESIWSSVLGLDVMRSDEEMGADWEQEAKVIGCVQITGDWEGAVMLKCPTELARLAGAIMFGVEIESGTADEAEDALGELTNMIAGNLKSLLPGICYLSLPIVVNGLDYRTIVPGSRPLCQVAFKCREKPFKVMLLERDEDQPVDGEPHP